MIARGLFTSDGTMQAHTTSESARSAARKDDSGSAREIRTYRRLCGRYVRTCIVGMADHQVVQEYADDLRSLLAKSSITEQRSFLKSFVERIEVDKSEAKVYYTIPMPPYSVSEETVGVLPFVHLL